MPILRDATDSAAVDALSAHAERFFWRLLQKCCDYGRFHAEPRLLTSMLFPLKRHEIRDTDSARWLAECKHAGLVRCYVDHSGRQLLQVLKWRDGKKFKKSAFDPPEGQAHLDLPPPPKQEKFLTRRNEVEVEGKEKENQAPPGTNGERSFKRQLWQLLKDERTLVDRIQKEKSACQPNLKLLTAFQTQLKQLRQEISGP